MRENPTALRSEWQERYSFLAILMKQWDKKSKYAHYGNGYPERNTFAVVFAILNR